MLDSWTFRVPALVTTIGLLASSSALANNLPVNAIANINSYSQPGYCAELLAGQTTPAGNVCFGIDLQADQLTVSFNATNGWVLLDTHLWVGDANLGFPQTKKGSPVPGQFPYKSGALSAVNSYSVVIELGQSLAGWRDGLTCERLSSLFAMSHAVVGLNTGSGLRTETAWSDGSRVLEKGGWATQTGLDVFISCPVIEEPEEPPVQSTETAFAVFTGSTNESVIVDTNRSACFSNFGFDRWGWSNAIASGTSSYLAIYAGAAQCNLSKGKLVGYLQVTPSATAGVLEVTYTAFKQYKFNEFHLYIGTDVLARKGSGYTVSPGQFPTVLSVNPAATSQTFLVTVPAGALYLVAHAVTVMPAE